MVVALSHNNIGAFDCAFWTDGSFRPDTNQSSSACYGFDVHQSPIERQSTQRSKTYQSVGPSGIVASSYTPEALALQQPIKHISLSPSTFTRKRIFIGVDSQSSLTGLNPFKRPKFGKLDTTPIHQYMFQQIQPLQSLLHLQWIPSHVGLLGNTEADTLANNASASIARSINLALPIESATTCTLIRQRELKTFHNSLELCSNLQGHRYTLCQCKKSNFRARDALPRPIQTLYSRWRLGQVDSCGTYPRKLTWIANPACRFCGFPKETIAHLITNCPGTAPFRSQHGLSLSTLINDTCDNMILIAQFDSFLRSVLPYDSPPNCTPIDDCLEKIASTDMPTTPNAEENLHPKEKRPKLSKQRLVIPTHVPSL